MRQETDKYYVTQVGRRLDIFNRDTGEIVNSYVVPDAWGNGWGWNITPSGLDIELNIILPLFPKTL